MVQGNLRSSNLSGTRRSTPSSWVRHRRDGNPNRDTQIKRPGGAEENELDSRASQQLEIVKTRMTLFQTVVDTSENVLLGYYSNEAKLS
jgi:hypothetical protein